MAMGGGGISSGGLRPIPKEIDDGNDYFNNIENRYRGIGRALSSEREKRKRNFLNLD